MSKSPDPNLSTDGADDAQRTAPPQSKLFFVTFPNEADVDQAVGAIVTKLTSAEPPRVYRLALVARGDDGKLSVRDITEESHGTIGAGALIGGLAGLSAGPLGAAIGAGAGALLGWSAEMVNEEAVDEFANRDWSELAPGDRAIVAEVSEETAHVFEALMAANGGKASR
jgi:uncharacterized membrane protein